MSRRVVVEPERLHRWFERFAEAHGGAVSTTFTTTDVTVRTADGARATVSVPFAPLRLDAPTANAAEADRTADAPDLGRSVELPDADPAEGGAVVRPGLAVDELVEHLARPRRVALLLVRLGGHSVGVASGGAVELSSTDRRLVHGRHRAGGSSSGRFARRREGQARVALRAAADTAARVLLPLLEEVDAVVLGGDRRALDELRSDRRLAPVFARAEPAVLDVPQPRRSVLDDAAERVRCAVIAITDPVEKP